MTTHRVHTSKVTDSDLWEFEVIISSSLHRPRRWSYPNSIGSGYQFIGSEELREMGIYAWDPDDDYDSGYYSDYDYENGFCVPVYSTQINRDKLIDKIFDLNINDFSNTLAKHWPKTN
jgi:hypothetical protein